MHRHHRIFEVCCLFPIVNSQCGQPHASFAGSCQIAGIWVKLLGYCGHWSKAHHIRCVAEIGMEMQGEVALLRYARQLESKVEKLQEQLQREMRRSSGVPSPYAPSPRAPGIGCAPCDTPKTKTLNVNPKALWLIRSIRCSSVELANTHKEESSV